MNKNNIIGILRTEIKHLEEDRLIPLRERLKQCKVNSMKYKENKILVIKYEARMYEVFKLLKIWEGKA